MSTDLDALRAAARCTDCELSEDATQAVFGAGPPSAWLMLVGEQPGDREDLVRACRHWFDDELDVVGPQVVATLGATAAKALVGPDVRITGERGRAREWNGRQLVPTVHPSSILRGPPDARESALDALATDLSVAAALRPR
ncbi:MAG: uracil-DNA glycosylase [Pseudonocardia sp.]|uniref:uracil-DNA glycosylase family protein n=1 Tax=unclassified Pseudonocardia TaxID=2619320 RepID=UPI0008683717|nr:MULTISPECIES: uracil-DNA glycosylase family protein [unclassified Pseudonocardia]MBN9107617.1 uracil-DNA glycosylase [Pseudonocardia sp.]ODU24155.1 MAG: hypothetical protein ABS80_13290 [Pseudonocardia sp. SCN 72-51]ODV08463.1 MAG: hypothetical protein ABT15_04160 [Pseudonocardia sp. SCN 73-27]